MLSDSQILILAYRSIPIANTEAWQSPDVHPQCRLSY